MAEADKRETDRRGRAEHAVLRHTEAVPEAREEKPGMLNELKDVLEDAGNTVLASNHEGSRKPERVPQGPDPNKSDSHRD